MLHQTPERFAGSVDNPEYIVTSFRCRIVDLLTSGLGDTEQAIATRYGRTKMPTSLQTQVAEALKPKKPGKAPRQERQSARVEFLGTPKNPADVCAAPELANQLAVRGFVPLKLRCYVTGYRDGAPILRVNIFWFRRNTHDDRPLLGMLIDRNRYVFQRLQGFTWNIHGVEFVKETRRVILLDFSSKQNLAPSLRWGTLKISDTNQLYIG